MMAATLDRDRDTASEATDAPHLPAVARNVRRPGRASILQRPLCEDRMGSLNVGMMARRKGTGCSGNDEYTKVEVLWVRDEMERRQGTEDGGRIQDAPRRRRRNE